MIFITENSNIFEATEGYCHTGIAYTHSPAYEGISGVDKGFSIQIIEDPAEDLADSKAILDRKDEPSQPLDEVFRELDIDE